MLKKQVTALTAGLTRGVVAASLGLLSGCQPATRPVAPPRAPGAGVRVARTPGGAFQLLKNGVPFRIRGGAGAQYFDRLRAAGGNSVRLYSTDYAGPLLAEAQRQGLNVMLGLWMTPESQGFDYYDPVAVQAQLAGLRTQILRYRHHPALLMWCVGNELDLGARNNKVYTALNQVVELIHELDPNHPVTTAVLSTLRDVSSLRRWSPALDILSVNSFGGLGTLPTDIRASGWPGPYIVTEFGARGPWEVQKARTPWQAPLEQNSAEKAAFARGLYARAVLSDTARCLGAYAFYWGQKFEQTPTWFSLFTEAGEKTALVDELHRAWRGQYPANRVPTISRLTLNGRRDVNFPRLRLNTTYEAAYEATDPEGRPLTARWELWPELPLVPDSTRLPARAPLTGYVRPGPGAGRIRLRTPAQAGAYRLLLYVADGQGGAATANIPFYCPPDALVRR